MDVFFCFLLSFLGISLAFFLGGRTSLLESFGIGFIFFWFGGTVIYLIVSEIFCKMIKVEKPLFKMTIIFILSFLITFSIIKSSN